MAVSPSTISFYKIFLVLTVNALKGVNPNKITECAVKNLTCHLV